MTFTMFTHWLANVAPCRTARQGRWLFLPAHQSAQNRL